MGRPNFFIVGAPKCGTTALHEYLKPHPEIFMSEHKEPHYFSTDLKGWRFDRFREHPKDYFALFDGVKNEKRVGESSVWYLYSQCAAREIHNYDPKAQIIIMIREPAEMLYSLYQQIFFVRIENLTTFREALDAEADRKQGKRIPPNLFTNLEILFYRDVVRYTGQIQRYYDLFGREQVHIIVYDDFKADTQTAYRKTLEFLEVDPNFTTDLRVINANKEFRNERIQNFLMQPPTWLMSVGKLALPVARPIYWRLRNLNTGHVKRAPIDPEFEQQIKREFRPEVERLSTLLNRDLTHWCAE